MSTESSETSARGKVDLVGHVRLPAGQFPVSEAPANIILRSDDPALAWVFETTSKIGDWRSECRSTYIRWALCINGLHVAADSYAARKEEAKEFVVRSVRPDTQGRASETVIAKWMFDEASRNHLAALPMLAAYGIIDLFACLEELLFEAYLIWHNHHPLGVLAAGPDRKELRKLYRARGESEEALSLWTQAWEQRKADWQRNRIYDGLDRVLLAYCNQVGLRKPNSYRSGPEQWAESLRIVAHVRNMLVHGATSVDAQLADMGKLPHCVGFRFDEGDPLELDLQHLMNVEHFCDALLTALNLSLVETFGPQLPKAPQKVRPLDM